MGPGRWIVGMIIPESTMYHTLHSIYVTCIMIYVIALTYRAATRSSHAGSVTGAAGSGCGREHVMRSRLRLVNGGGRCEHKVGLIILELKGSSMRCFNDIDTTTLCPI